MIESKKLNAFFNECFKLNIQTTLDNDLLKYHYNLYGVTKDYEEFEKYVISKYGSKGGGIFAEKDKMIFSVLKDVIVNPIYYTFSKMENILNVSPSEILFGLIENNKYDEFKNLIKTTYKEKNPFEDLKNFIENNEKNVSFASKAIDKKMRDINNFVKDDLKLIATNNKIHKFLYDFVKENVEYFNKYHPETNVVSNLFSRRFTGKSIISIDLKKANHQALFHLGILEDPDFDSYICTHTDDKYLKLNKSIRQVIYGNLNSKRIGSFQRIIMNNLYYLLSKKDLVGDCYIVSDDELIVVSDSDVNSDNFKLTVSNVDSAINELSKVFNNKLVLNKLIYKLSHFETNKGDMFYKKYVTDSVNTDLFEIKGVNSKYYPQVFKLITNKEIEDKDLMFEDKDTQSICKFTEKLKIFNK